MSTATGVTEEKLKRILTAERDRGYRDVVVMGGLGSLVKMWRAGEASANVRAALNSLEGYADAGAAERERMLAKALAYLEAKPRAAAPVVKRPLATGDSRPTCGPSVPTPRQTAPVRARVGGALDVDSDVKSVYGISDAYAKRLARLGIRTVGDLIMHVPRRYVDYSSLKKVRDLVPGETETVRGQIWEIRESKSRQGLSVVSAIVGDETGTVQAIWFNQPYLTRTLSHGKEVVLSGRVTDNLGNLQLKSPDWELAGGDALVHTGRLVPKYPLVDGITDRWLRSVLHRVLHRGGLRIIDELPSDVCGRQGLLELSRAVASVHFPESDESVVQARRRLAFDELLVLQIAVQSRRQTWKSQPGFEMPLAAERVDEFCGALPFRPTGAQRRVMSEILGEMGSSRPMTRLLQGDVGSGKTLVALVAALAAIANGYQVVLMAPTEILAQQHFGTISALLGLGNGSDGEPCRGAETVRGLGRGVGLGLLTASLKRDQRAMAFEGIESGSLDLVVGTHALIEPGVSFARLGLVIVDEQHRFGVMQRVSLRQKGFNPDLLVMTATPIPRSLALTLYGDLDVSLLDEIPPGRQEIATRWLGSADRQRAYEFVREQVRQGRQAYVVCPLVEESEKLEVKAATEEHRRLRDEVFPDLRVGLVHGRMKATEKDAAMSGFKRGELDILVATAVIEVGVDVPNATVMVVEGADRFGLAQLHQFRGRVGRGSQKSYCILLSEARSAEAEQRLMTLQSVSNGFELAERDLEMRGPGEFFGTRQSGLPDLKIARYTDVGLLSAVRSEAERIVGEGKLAFPEYALLKERVAHFQSSIPEAD